MIQHVAIDTTQNNLIAFKATGTLTEEDLNALQMKVREIVHRGQGVKWYFEMEDFTGWDASAFWEDLKMDAVHANDYLKIAMVGEKKWQNWITQFMKPFTRAEINYFGLEEKAIAKEWIREN